MIKIIINLTYVARVVHQALPDFVEVEGCGDDNWMSKDLEDFFLCNIIQNVNDDLMEDIRPRFTSFTLHNPI